MLTRCRHLRLKMQAGSCLHRTPQRDREGRALTGCPDGAAVCGQVGVDRFELLPMSPPLPSPQKGEVDCSSSRLRRVTLLLTIRSRAGRVQRGLSMPDPARRQWILVTPNARKRELGCRSEKLPQHFLPLRLCRQRSNSSTPVPATHRSRQSPHESSRYDESFALLRPKTALSIPLVPSLGNQILLCKQPSGFRCSIEHCARRSTKARIVILNCTMSSFDQSSSVKTNRRRSERS